MLLVIVTPTVYNLHRLCTAQDNTRKRNSNTQNVDVDNLPSINAREVVERAKHLIGAKSDKQLASLLGVSPSRLSNWTQRGTLDYERFIVLFASKCDLTWLFYGRPSIRAPYEAHTEMSHVVVNTTSPNDYQRLCAMQEKFIESLLTRLQHYEGNGRAPASPSLNALTAITESE